MFALLLAAIFSYSLYHAFIYYWKQRHLKNIPGPPSHSLLAGQDSAIVHWFGSVSDSEVNTQGISSSFTRLTLWNFTMRLLRNMAPSCESMECSVYAHNISCVTDPL